MDYEGTVVMVSHDRDFMKGICSRLFEFRDGKVKEHLCDIEEFMQLRKVERLNELDLEKVQDLKPKSQSDSKVELKKETKMKDDKQIQNQIKKSEEKIALLEMQLKEKNEILSNPNEFLKVSGDKKFFDEYEKLKKDLEMEMETWEKLSKII